MAPRGERKRDPGNEVELGNDLFALAFLFCVITSRNWLKRTRAIFSPIRSKTEYEKLWIVPGTRGFLHVNLNQTGQCLKHLFIPIFLTHSTTWKLKAIKFVA